MQQEELQSNGVLGDEYQASEPTACAEEPSPAFLDFADLAPIEVPIKVGGVVKYVLREADGDAASKFRAANIRNVEFVHHENDDRTFRNLSGSVTSGYELLGQCLFIANGEGKINLDRFGLPDKRFLASRTAILMMNSAARDKLLEKLKEISHLDEADTLPAMRKQRDRLDRQIAKLEAAEALAKKSRTAGENGCGSVTD